MIRPEWEQYTPKQQYTSWWTQYPSTHVNAGESVQVVTWAWAKQEIDALTSENMRLERELDQLTRSQADD